MADQIKIMILSGVREQGKDMLLFKLMMKFLFLMRIKVP